jgi:hypothetical protein
MGELCTLKFIREHHKPYLDVYIRQPLPVEEVVAWIRRERIMTLNVGGNSEPKGRKAMARGITDFVVAYLGKVFEALGHRRVE